MENTLDYGMWLPPDFSTHGGTIDTLIAVLHVMMFFLFFGWGAFFVYCLFKFKAREGGEAQYTPIKAKLSKYVEFGVIGAEVLLLFGLSVPLWGRYKTMPAEDADPERIRVIAQQFAWNCHYPGEDGIFGETKPQLVNAAGGNYIGLNEEDPNAQDDIITVNQFYMPIGRPVVVELSSLDVIHSFFIPVLRVKQDAVPGMRIPIWFESDKDKGTWSSEISCAQLCGNGHSKMRGEVHAFTQEDYEAKLAEEGAFFGAEDFFEDDEEMEFEN